MKVSIVFSLTIFGFPFGLDLLSGENTPPHPHQSDLFLDFFQLLGLPEWANVRDVLWKGRGLRSR